MSHELSTNAAGQVEFAYLKSDALPWHGLGQPMEDGASLDEWRGSAGMDWRIKRSKVRYATSADTSAPLIEMPDKHVLFRSDDSRSLGVVSAGYKVVQPKEVLEFFRDIARAGGLELSAAGVVFNGRRFWATAKIGEASPVSVRDKINGYILISTSADGSLSTEVRQTSVRAVCNNTLSMALGSAASFKVTHRSVFDPTSVKTQMGLNEAAWDAFKHNMIRLANKPMDETAAEAFVANLLGGGEKVQQSAAYNKILDLFNGSQMGADLDGVQGTAYGVLQATTEFVDHWQRAQSQENRFVSSQWGPGSALKTAAMVQLLAA